MNYDRTLAEVPCWPSFRPERKRRQGKVVLRERDAIDRYRLWQQYRRIENSGPQLTFVQWLEQSAIEIAEPERW